MSRGKIASDNFITVVCVYPMDFAYICLINRWTNSFTNADTTFHDTEFIDPHESALRVVCRRGSTDVQ